MNGTLNFFNGHVFKLEMRNVEMTETWGYRVLTPVNRTVRNLELNS